ncbi:hypothetical protein K1T71_002039 [Dendrolimus kikuchii]|uniref:Uncharacterized protein n=1 Tax=Dendrolimus kikuchii TaxID=765133 RepID=A0ACC1DFK4_9NEOP|nr:hypothetical protein K1T71_002039 [Dendrolimus kikuchii]
MIEKQSEVKDMIQDMQRFSWVDYTVFILMLAISAVVGVYWGFMKKQTTQSDYLLGGRNMKVVPVAMSLVASFVSGITLLGSPTEVYMYGTQYAYIIGAIFLMSFVMTQVYLPVFHELRITSNYEYLSIRFDNRVRLFGSVLFAFTLVGWLPIVIYVPALAFNQVTGVDVHVITPIVCLVCIFYTSIGGLQAVVWTDVIQITAMFIAMALVAIKGTIDVGGVGVVWQRNMDSGRIEPPDWDASPLTRHTIWCLVIGGLAYWLQANAVNQTMVQRYLALPTLRGAKCLHFMIFLVSIFFVIRLQCHNSLTTKATIIFLFVQLAKAKDQLLPLLVMDVLGDIPGLPGVFVAGIFSAALSSLSTSLNSMSAVVLEDFYKPFFKKELTDKQTAWLMRGVVILLGSLCVALVFIVEKMGTILQLTMTLESMTMGPQLGVFTMGILMPWIDATGALIGGMSGLISMSWWCLTAQMAIAQGQISHPHKILTIEGCRYNFTMVQTDSSDQLREEVNPLLRVSYMWYTLAGAVMAISVGNIVSQVNRVRGIPHLSPAPGLLAPQLRWMFKEPPHPTDEPFIRAYGNNKVRNIELSLQTFGGVDYFVFVVMLAICGAIGVYFGFVDKQNSTQDYLMGGRNMKLVPVTFSLVASFISGISLLGIPTEIYLYGTAYIFVLIGALSMSIITSYTFLPVLYELQITSAYEYLELRFDKRLRIFGSVIYSIYLMAWLPIVIYVPALAFNQVTGINIHVISPIVCAVCIFYTCLGGLKAVVWTDVIQTIIMVGAMILVLIKATIKIGGFGEVFKSNWDTDRIEFPSYALDLTTRHSIWSVSIGATFYWIGSIAVNQSMMQRFLSLSSLESSKRAVWGFLGGVILIVALCGFAGLVTFARYYECDPLNSKLALAKDQLLPLLVMDVMSEWKGMPGIFVAGVFSASLSSLSTGLNSMAAVVLEDFWKPFCKKLSHTQTQILVRLVVVVLGFVCVGLVFVVERLGSVLQLTISLSSASVGPIAGLFLMGMFLPFIDSTSALSGSSIGIISAWWIVAKAQLAQANGSLRFVEKERFTNNCTYVYEPTNVPYLYQISYLWYTAFGCSVTIIVACVVSLLQSSTHLHDKRLFAPVLRRWITKKYEVQQIDLKVVKDKTNQKY